MVPDARPDSTCRSSPSSRLLPAPEKNVRRPAHRSSEDVPGGGARRYTEGDVEKFARIKCSFNLLGWYH
jgi:hypothetical protein